MSEFLCAIRHEPISSTQYLTSQQEHGRGKGQMAKGRVFHEGARAMAWTNLVERSRMVDVGDRSDHTALVKAWHKRVNDEGATPRKNAAIGMHLLAVVSDKWIEEGENPTRQKQILYRESRRWAEKTFGAGSLFGARIDLNERGRASVDLFICPVRTQRIGRTRIKRRMVAPSAALAELARSQGLHECRTYTALQNSWAAHCAENMDERIKRGKYKTEKGEDRLTPEEYGAGQDKEKIKRRNRTVRRLLGAFRKTAPKLFKRVAGDDLPLVEPMTRARDARPHKEMPVYEDLIEVHIVGFLQQNAQKPWRTRMEKAKCSARSFIVLVCSVCLALPMLFTGEASAQHAAYEVPSEAECRFGELFVPYAEAEKIGMRPYGRYPGGGFCVPVDYRPECAQGGWANGIGFIAEAVAWQWGAFAVYAGFAGAAPVAAGAGLVSLVFGAVSFGLTVYCS